MTSARMTQPLRVVSVHGTPFEMGAQRGSVLKPLIATRIHGYLEALLGRGFSVERLRPLAVTAGESLQHEYPAVWQELMGIANGADVPVEELLMAVMGTRVASARPDTGWLGAQAECSIVGAPGRRGRPIGLKTADVPLDYRPYWTVIRARPIEGHAYVAAGFFPETPGGTEGINEIGLCAGGSGVATWDGYQAVEAGAAAFPPVSVLYGELLRTCRTVEEGIAFLTSQKHGGPYGRNCLLMDTSGQVAIVERAARTSYVRYRGWGPTWATNVFSSEQMQALSATEAQDPSSYTRLRRIEALIAGRADGLGPADLQALARDHEHGPGNRSICRHGPLWHTLASVIFDPAVPGLWVAHGRPCETEHYELLTP